MARMSKAQQIARENEEQALTFFETTLGALPDPRRRQGQRYPLRTVVVTALMAMVCGCDDAEAMQSWGEANAQWLAGMLDMPHGPPTQDVFLAVFGALDPEAFSAVFRAWAQVLALRLKGQDKHIAVDGKTSRRSFDTASGLGAIHTVSAWLSEAADDRRRAVDEQPRPAVEVFEASDKGHGRVETRTVSLCRDLSWITTPERWPGLSFVAQIVRERTILATGTTSTEAAYDIGSGADATAATASSAIRGHWGIENQLHWVLDLAFREDEARHRAKNTAQNLTTLRHFALNIVKQDPDRKLGVANSRKRAGWDRDYLIKTHDDG